ncbi:MAG: hypothetical protein O6940_09510 [Ignavibacteria bacterium]|nr:hypothetical protein [Ignavibacteria bacterium]
MSKVLGDFSAMICTANLLLELIGISTPNPELFSLARKYVAESDKNKESYLREIKQGFELLKQNLPAEEALQFFKLILEKTKSINTNRRLFLVSGRAASGKSFVSQKLRNLFGNMEVVDGDGYLLPTRKERAKYENQPLKKFQLPLFESHLTILSYSTDAIPEWHYSEWDGQVVTNGKIGKNLENDIIVDSVFYGTLEDYERLTALSTAAIFVATEDSVALVNRIRRDLKFRNASCDIVYTKIQNDYVRLLKQHIPLNWIYLKKSKFVLLTQVESSNKKEYPFHYSYSIYARKKDCI